MAVMIRNKEPYPLNFVVVVHGEEERKCKKEDKLAG